MDLTVVVPLFNESSSLRELCSLISESLGFTTLRYEIIFIDDGSTDDSWQVIKALFSQNNHVRAIRFQSNYGKSQALHAGFKISKGKVVVTMDADLQDNPKEIIPLYEMIVNEDYDLVSGWKKVRYDNYFTKNIPSKIFNWAAQKTSGLKLHDFNCGIKAYKNEVIKNINVTGEMHRYIPVLAKNKGFTKIGEKVVQHQARKFGETKFGNGRFIKGFLDLITIWFISRFAKKPMHLFGTLGLLMFFVGGGLTLYLGIDKLFINTTGRLLTSKPQFYMALFTMLIGVQFFLAGFLGDLILSIKFQNKYYIISEKL